MNNKKQNSSFTLIELLIVVSIITILAAIATENLMLAGVRSKIARNKAEFRTLAAAIELYTADHNAPPRMAHWTFYGDESLDNISGQNVAGIMSNVLSTPIAYMTQARLFDPFMENNEYAPLDERVYTYQDILSYTINRPTSQFWPSSKDYYGNWRIGGVGPDLVFDHGFANSAQLPYDPTNGTISFGNIWYSQNGFQEELPPIPTLLGEH